MLPIVAVGKNPPIKLYAGLETEDHPLKYVVIVPPNGGVPNDIMFEPVPLFTVYAPLVKNICQPDGPLTLPVVTLLHAPEPFLTLMAVPVLQAEDPFRIFIAIFAP